MVDATVPLVSGPAFPAQMRVYRGPFWRDPYFRKFLTVSAAVHAIAFGAAKLTFTSALSAPPGITVGIAAFNGGKPAAPSSGPKTPATTESAQPEAAQRPAQPQAVQPAPQSEAVKPPEPAQARTDVTPDAKTVVLNARKRPAKPTEKAKAKPAADAAATKKPSAEKSGSSVIASLQDMIKKERKSAGGAASGGTGSGAGGGGGGTAVAGVMGQIYVGRLQSHLAGFWDVPPGARNQDLYVDVKVIIDRDGRLLRSTVEHGSGYGVFDDSAIRAIQKAKPYPPPPADLNPPVELTLRMRPPQK